MRVHEENQRGGETQHGDPEVGEIREPLVTQACQRNGGRVQHVDRNQHSGQHPQSAIENLADGYSGGEKGFRFENPEGVQSPAGEPE